MRVIRRIEASESDAFLHILCSVFGLDPTRARPVFFDPAMYDLSRKWGVFVNGDLVSILTTTGLRFGWGRCIGIAGVATLDHHRGQGHAQALLERVLAQAEADGEGPAMLFAYQQTVYKRAGFQLTDEVVRGTISASGPPDSAPQLDSDAVVKAYSQWAAETPDRLIREKDRWQYWNLALRICEPFMDGYLVVEPGLVREAVVHSADTKWQVPTGTQWLGLRSVTEACNVPVRRPKTDLLLMARNVPGRPQMFMTDQF